MAGLIGAASAVGFALLVSWLFSLLIGSEGRLGFGTFDALGLLEGAVFIIAFSFALIYVRSALRLPSPVLLSFGIIGPPTAGRSAEKVPVVDAARLPQVVMENRIAIVEAEGVPVGVTGLHQDRITPWEELVKVDAGYAVSDLRRLLAHESLVIVMDGGAVAGVVTQEMYLAGLWGSVR